VLSGAPLAIQLRYLETLTVIAADKNSTIVFPLPMDIIAPLLKALPNQGSGIGNQGSAKAPDIAAPS
jgi:hypothetical protein